MRHAQSLECPIRGRGVIALPEEIVRVKLMHFLLAAGFPKNSVVVEKELSQLPHLLPKSSSLPQRRIDVVCFATGIHLAEGLYPLLLVECKAIPLSSKMQKQVIGYNHFVEAYFVALVNQTESWLGWQDRRSGRYKWITHLPTYGELLHFLQNSQQLRA